MPAQIFAAAAASTSGPATSRSCIPSPLLFSRITMIGRNAPSGAFDLDFKRPRHNARKPPTEFAPPTSTPKSVRWTATLIPKAGNASDPALSAGGGSEATTCRSCTMGVAFAPLSGSTNLLAAASGGAMIDLAATSGGDGAAAGGTEGLDAIVGACSAGAVSSGGLSGAFAEALATGDRVGGGALCNSA